MRADRVVGEVGGTVASGIFNVFGSMTPREHLGMVFLGVIGFAVFCVVAVLMSVWNVVAGPSAAMTEEIRRLGAFNATLALFLPAVAFLGVACVAWRRGLCPPPVALLACGVAVLLCGYAGYARGAFVEIAFQSAKPGLSRQTDAECRTLFDASARTGGKAFGVDDMSRCRWYLADADKDAWCMRLFATGRRMTAYMETETCSGRSERLVGVERWPHPWDHGSGAKPAEIRAALAARGVAVSEEARPARAPRGEAPSR